MQRTELDNKEDTNMHIYEMQLECELERIIKDFNMGHIIVSLDVAAKIKAMSKFRERTELEKMTLMDSAGMINVGFLGNVLVIADTNMYWEDDGIYAYGNTEETHCEISKICSITRDIYNI
jgi:hypothetical protein